MKCFKDYEFWFITGSQHLYGPETLKHVAEDSRAIVEGLNKSRLIPANIVYKPTVTTPEEITQVIKEANYDDKCAGIITWMHTFSPSKMWINGLKSLNKPLLHFHTQFNREIPVNDIDMDFMNLNQSAHGDREHGFIGARLRLPRKIAVGYWEEEKVQNKIGNWMRSAIGVAASSKLKVVRFGDNMRQVAVTEGDKVEAQIKLGWQVNTHGIGDLVEEIKKVTDSEVDALMEEYREKYDIITENIDSVKYQGKVEIALKKFFAEHGFNAYTDTFEDLWGMDQLPGLASQRMMEAGFGFAGEGDWKTAAMVAVMKVMETGLKGGTTFMEDYTYHLENGNELILGAHMLEICPSIAEGRVSIDVEPLGIGGKNPPARMKFKGRAGDAICVSLIDLGNRMRIIVNDVKAVTPIADMPKLPVAQVMWKPMPNLETSAEAWILAGGAHHTVFSYTLTAEHIRDFAEMLDIEFVHINEKTDINDLKRDLMLADIAWKLK
jgi:L-arabinose isomerase